MHNVFVDTNYQRQTWLTNAEDSGAINIVGLRVCLTESLAPNSNYYLQVEHTAYGKELQITA